MERQSIFAGKKHKHYLKEMESNKDGNVNMKMHSPEQQSMGMRDKKTVFSSTEAENWPLYFEFRMREANAKWHL